MDEQKGGTSEMQINYSDNSEVINQAIIFVIYSCRLSDYGKEAKFNGFSAVTH